MTNNIEIHILISIYVVYFSFYLVCKLLAQELTENFNEHNSPSVIETSYSLDSKQSKKTKYSDSYVLYLDFLSFYFSFKFYYFLINL